jgi:M6 family metalloprotease-like protein
MRLRMVVLLALSLLAVAAQAMPAHPDLLQRLGPERVAALQRGNISAKGGYASLAEPLLRHRGERTPPMRGTGTCLFILWQWADHAADEGSHPTSAYEELIFSVGTYPTGSMNDFYLEASFGDFQVGGDMVGWTTAATTYASYANPDGSQDPNTCRQMIRDAIAQLDATVDFSQWDNDGPDGVPNSGDDDGYVDALFFVHAGPGQEATGNPQDIWSHASWFSDLGTNDGVAIGGYSVEPEEMPDGNLNTVGVYCHEYGHVLGLPDLYDVDYSSSGIGEWGLMAGGSWNYRPGDLAGSCPSQLTAWCKSQLGWITPINVIGDASPIVIPPAALNPIAYRIFRGGATTGDEYFLVENRQPVGFDAGLVRRQVMYGLAQPQGLVIYHIDEAVSGNSNDRHRLVDVEEATPWVWANGDVRENLDGVVVGALRRFLWAYNRGDNGDPWPGFATFNADSTDWVGPRDRNRFADDTTPSAHDYGCEPTGVAVTDITLYGDLVACAFDLSTPTSDVVAVPAPVVWDFEDGNLSGWRGCESFAHFDQSLAGDCPGDGGVWFGTDGWNNCGGIGYGNQWNDALVATFLVGIDTHPVLTIAHRYELEADYDFARVEVRPAGGEVWTELGAFTSYAGCRWDDLAIPADVLEAGRVGESENAQVDLRLRLVSDQAWSAEDGLECGIGWWVDRVAVSGVAVAVPEVPAVAASAAAMLPAAPNPFNPITVIRCHVPAGAADASLRVFDASGRLVRTLLSGAAPAGWQEVRWDGRNDRGARVASGLYFARFEAGGQVVVEKLALVK